MFKFLGLISGILLIYCLFFGENLSSLLMFSGTLLMSIGYGLEYYNKTRKKVFKHIKNSLFNINDIGNDIKVLNGLVIGEIKHCTFKGTEVSYDINKQSFIFGTGHFDLLEDFVDMRKISESDKTFVLTYGYCKRFDKPYALNIDFYNHNKYGENR